MNTIITTVVFNALPYTVWMLESLYKNTDYNFELIIVNNGSSDGTDAYLNWFCQNYPRATVIHLPKNIGYSSGQNEAFNYIKEKNMQYDYICTLNNDTLVASGWLNSLIKTSMKDERIGMVGAVSNNAGGEQGYQIRIPFMELPKFEDFAVQWREKMKGQISREGCLVGFCMLITKKCFEQCFPYPENLTTFDDNYVCLLALHKGFTLAVDRSTIIWHYGQKSFHKNQIDLGKKMKEMSEKFELLWKEKEKEYWQ